LSELQEPHERETQELHAALLASAAQKLKQLFTVHWIFLPKQFAQLDWTPTPRRQLAAQEAWLGLE